MEKVRKGLYLEILNGTQHMRPWRRWEEDAIIRVDLKETGCEVRTDASEWRL